MKVIIIKDHQLGSNKLIKGQSCEMITSIAEQLIEDGICEANNNVTLRDTIVEDKAEEVSEEILDELPDNASDLVEKIPFISNMKVLEELATDDRKTVSKAANKRLNELK